MAWLMLGAMAQAQSPPTPKSPRVQYESPQAVFEAYRQAIANGDMRTLVYCYVREIREDAYQMVVEANLAAACAPRFEPKVTAVFKRFGLNMTAIEAKYAKQYKTKHGVDSEAAQDA